MPNNNEILALLLGAFKKTKTELNEKIKLLEDTRITHGTNGLNGVDGIQGVMGTQGTTGVGVQGSVGIQGTTGTQGTVGAQGVSGIGIQGSTGSRGTDGVQGTIGTQGTIGSQGFTGSHGKDGTHGLNGVQGTIGTQGATGIGVQGATGDNGKAGTQGATGIGVQGATGDTGVQGTTGKDGVSYSEADLQKRIASIVDKYEADFKRFKTILTQQVSQSGWGSTSSGGGSVNIRDNDDVVFSQLADTPDNAVFIFDAELQKFKPIDFQVLLQEFGVGTSEAMKYTKLVDKIDNITSYIGEALPSTLVSAASWRIQKIVDNNGDMSITWASGTSDFDKVWDDRLSFVYS